MKIKPVFLHWKKALKPSRSNFLDFARRGEAGLGDGRTDEFIYEGCGKDDRFNQGSVLGDD